jgi:hypothetical protein
LLRVLFAEKEKSIFCEGSNALLPRQVMRFFRNSSASFFQPCGVSTVSRNSISFLTSFASFCVEMGQTEEAHDEKPKKMRSTPTRESNHGRRKNHREKEATPKQKPPNDDDSKEKHTLKSSTAVDSVGEMGGGGEGDPEVETLRDEYTHAVHHHAK